MRIVITGVPGTGKTEIAKQLAKRLRYPIIEVNKVIETKKLWKVKDEFGARIALMAPLEKALLAEIAKHKHAIIEGHLACEFSLPADFIVVCRTDPDTLEARLEARKYPKEKLEENVFAEMLDYCSIYSAEHYEKGRILEIDTTDKTIGESVSEVLKALKGKKQGKPANIDWSKQLEKRISRKR